MRKPKLVEFRPMQNRVKNFTKVGVNRIDVRSRVKALADQASG